jgi:hypothetical protein
MKSWDEAKEGMTIYLGKEIEISDSNDVVVDKTKMFQKATIENIDKYSKDNYEIMIIINGGKYDGMDFYFHTKEDSPSELLTTDEYKVAKGGENAIWKSVKKIESMISDIKEPSDDLKLLKELINKHS